MASTSSPSSTAIQIHLPTNESDGEITANGTSPPMPATGPAPAVVMSSVVNLAQLLPTGTVLAYQALSPSFTTASARPPTSCSQGCWWPFSPYWASSSPSPTASSVAAMESYTTASPHYTASTCSTSPARKKGRSGTISTSFGDSASGRWTSCTPSSRRWFSSWWRLATWGCRTASSRAPAGTPRSCSRIYRRGWRFYPVFCDNAPRQKVVHPSN
ncbi:hypothetical protein CFC21_085293 [Triticum aestivum]|uniref:Uncharacterized protein n=2 Tax=Triticum aestivum TaxID=4565 RepID=A0A3B6NXL3_WHEAT|nr:hypothetical protein CFC21_085293 [Triticum aestivum]